MTKRGKQKENPKAENKSQGGQGPLDLFFKLAPKDPVKKAKFDYSLYWVIFIAFVALCINYLRLFILNYAINNLAWFFVLLVVCYFNFSALGQMRANKKLIASMTNLGVGLAQVKPEEAKNQTIQEMMDEFESKGKN